MWVVIAMITVSVTAAIGAAAAAYYRERSYNFEALYIKTLSELNDLKLDGHLFDATKARAYMVITDLIRDYRNGEFESKNMQRFD